jgi:outer membrane protein TolC
MGMTALVTAAVLLTAGAQEKPTKAMAEAPAKKVKELQNERIAALQNAADLSRRLAQSGRIDLRDALEDRLALLKAELDAAETESERISLYKKAVGSLKEYEALAQRRFEAARETDLNFNRIKARRLEIEIQLEQAKIKQAKGAK